MPKCTLRHWTKNQLNNSPSRSQLYGASFLSFIELHSVRKTEKQHFCVHWQVYFPYTMHIIIFSLFIRFTKCDSIQIEKYTMIDLKLRLQERG